VEELGATPAGTSILVPLNQSLYVPGKVVDPSKVLVELGTGYYCEKDTAAAKLLIDRKLQLLSKSIESIESVRSILSVTSTLE
jgi:prefoldin alpha subunit